MAARTTIAPATLNLLQAVGGLFPSISALTGTSAPAVPSSGTNATNSNAWAVVATISGGTLTQVNVNGAQVGTTAGAYWVPAGGTINIVYSVAPTWTWVASGVDAAGTATVAGQNAIATGWNGAATGVQFANSGTGQTYLWFYNGGTACTAYYLVGQKVQGDVFPYTQESITLPTNQQGWLGPWSPQKYNQPDTTQFSGAPAGAIGVAGQNMTCVDFTAVNTLVVRLYQLIPVSP